MDSVFFFFLFCLRNVTEVRVQVKKIAKKSIFTIRIWMGLHREIWSPMSPGKIVVCLQPQCFPIANRVMATSLLLQKNYTIYYSYKVVWTLFGIWKHLGDVTMMPQLRKSKHYLIILT